MKHRVHTEGGVIDPDFTGELQVILHNFGDTNFTVTQGYRIAQLILERFESPSVVIKDSIEPTDRGDNGFGSTGIHSLNSTRVFKPLQACDLTMSLHEPLDIIDINIMASNSHPTLGLNLDKNLAVISCIPGTPAAKIKGWRQTIKNTVLYTINGETVTTIHDVKQKLSLCSEHFSTYLTSGNRNYSNHIRSICIYCRTASVYQKG